MKIIVKPTVKFADGYCKCGNCGNCNKVNAQGRDLC